MKKNSKLILFCVIALALYLGSYTVFRTSNTEVWEKDNEEYVIFQNKAVYYLYRPLSLIDARMTEMKFHIGPHQDLN